MTRLTAHSSDDQQTKYRSADDLEAGKAHDPLPIFRAPLRDGGVLTDEIEAALTAEIAGIVDDATDYAEGEPDPDPATALDWVYAEHWPGETPPPWHPARRPAATAGGRGPLMPVRTFIEAIRDGMAEEMRRDETVVVLGEDVGKKGGVFLATDGLWGEFGDDRVIDTPLTESMIVGASIGAAINGLRPVAEIQFADFIHPAFNQLVSEAARMRYRSNNGFAVPMVVRAPYGGGVHGALYHSQSVEAFFTHVPGLKVVIPSTPYDAKGLLRTRDPRRRPGAVLRAQEDVPQRPRRGARRRLRGARWARRPSGGPAARSRSIAYGLMALYALEAAERVAGEGIDVEVVDLRSLRPLDRDTILSSVRKTGKCLVAYEDNRFGGYGAEICAIVAEEAFDYLDGPVTPDRRPRRPGRALQPRARGLVHAQPGEDRRRDPEARRVLMAAVAATSPPSRPGCERILDPYRDRLEPATIYNLPTLRRPGAKAHDWFAFVKPASKHVSFFLMPIVTWPDLLDGCSDALLERRPGEVGVHLRAPSTRPLFARARGARRAGVRAVRGRGLDRVADRDVGLRAEERADPRRLAVDRRPLGLRQPPPGRDLDRQPALLDLVGPGRRHRAADDHHLADPAGGPRHQRPAGERQQRLGLLLERQRVRVEARQQADGRSTGRWWRASSTSSLRTQHLGALGDDLDDAVAQRRDRLAQRRAALDAPPAGELALRAARERGQLALDDGADRVLAGLGHLAAQPGARVDEGDVAAVVGPEAQEAAAGGGLQERAPARR